MRTDMQTPLACALLAMATLTADLRAADDVLELSAGDAIFTALEEELPRAMSLSMDDVDPPYSVTFSVSDHRRLSLAGTWGALSDPTERAWRSVNARVRVGSTELDNTNYTGDWGGGGSAQLPVGDDVHAIRHALWQAVDGAYKDAVETYTNKLAYMRDKSIEDRPPEITPVPVVREVLPPATMTYDREALEELVRRTSARFRQHPSVQDSGVNLTLEIRHRYLVDSDGMRLRTPETFASLGAWVRMQAPDGYPLRDQLSAWAPQASGLPSAEELEQAVDAMIERLHRAAEADTTDNYTGPVLMRGPVGPAVLQACIAGGLSSTPDPVGRGRAANSLEKKLGLRILPRTFRAWDDPTATRLGDEPLAGHYVYDDEGVAGRRVELAEDGKLRATLIGRAPTRRQSGATGHARSSGWSGTPRPTVSNLFFEDDAPVAEDSLLDLLRTAAADEGLEYGVLVERFGGGNVGRGSGVSTVRLPEPLVAWKVWVDDGRLEPLHRMQFTPTDPKSLKRLLATGDVSYVHHQPGIGNGTSVIGPSLLFDELELTGIEPELDRLPLVPSPLQRD